MASLGDAMAAFYFITVAFLKRRALLHMLSMERIAAFSMILCNCSSYTGVGNWRNCRHNLATVKS